MQGDGEGGCRRTHRRSRRPHRDDDHRSPPLDREDAEDGDHGTTAAEEGGQIKRHLIMKRVFLSTHCATREGPSLFLPSFSRALSLYLSLSLSLFTLLLQPAHARDHGAEGRRSHLMNENVLHVLHCTVVQSVQVSLSLSLSLSLSPSLSLSLDPLSLIRTLRLDQPIVRCTAHLSTSRTLNAPTLARTIRGAEVVQKRVRLRDPFTPGATARGSAPHVYPSL